MAQISIEDFTGSVQLDLNDPSLLAESKLRRLTAPGSRITDVLSEPVTSPKFKDAKFAASFENPVIPLGKASLELTASVNSVIAVSRASPVPLFGSDDYDPIEIEANDCWVSFELDTAVRVDVTAPVTGGFGVSFGAAATPSFATYKLISGNRATGTTLKQAIEEDLNAFRILNSAEDVLRIQPDLIYASNVSGTIQLGGSWSLPLSVNQLSLADAKLPFHAGIAVSPEATVAVAGQVSLTSEFNIRFRRIGSNLVRVGVYKTQGKTFEASFTASAGLTAGLAGNDLIESFFSAVAPGISLGGLTAEDFAEIREVLNESIDRSLAVSLNAACSAAFSDEAAIVYDIDVSAPDQATRDALDSAIRGDWTAISKLSNARKIRNVVIDTVERQRSISVNVLGLYNYRSLADFVRSMRVLKDEADGSILITDSASATRITTASTPLAADSDRLRAALYQAFIATATYKALAAGIGTTASIAATQDFLLYEHAMSYKAALKQINAGHALGVMPVELKQSLPPSQDAVLHARFAASCSYGNDDVLRFFFGDIEAFTPRTTAELVGVGRSVLASLLDPQDRVDQQRISVLQDDQQWAALDDNPARIKAPYYSDWFDITTWADALARVAPLLADAIRYGKTLPGDPTADHVFMKKRGALLNALEKATHETRAAFEKSFPICVMATLSGRTRGPNPPDFEAAWNSKTIFTTRPAALTTGTAAQIATEGSVH